MRTIDINCDCGEGFGRWALGDDRAVMSHVTSVNLACGFHAGDPVTMNAAIRLASEQGVAIGAHPGLPDLLGFGRRFLDISAEEAFAYFAYQIGALRGLLAANGARLHHVKLHGVLPAMVGRDTDLAEAAVAAIRSAAPEALVYSPASRTSAFNIAVRRHGLMLIEEAYADMRYDDDGEVLVERMKRTVSMDEAAERVRKYLQDGIVESEQGHAIKVDAQSISFHGDTPTAAAVAAAVREAVEAEGWSPAAPTAGRLTSGG